jgi:beta-glucanase (GH16 family)
LKSSLLLFSYLTRFGRVLLPLFGIALLLYGFLGGGACVAQGQTLSLIWSDEFNGASIDLTKWTFDIGNGGDPTNNNPGWGNNELEYYTSNSANAYITNGFLHIHAQEQTTNTSEGTFYYTSARMKTQGLFWQTYGRIEWRASLPEGTGFWPALWMLGTNIDSVPWPGCGEIDVVENNGTPNFEQGSIHSSYDGGGNATKLFNFTGGESVTNFHVYDLDWTTNSIIWSVDGVGYETQTVWDSSTDNPYPFPFNQPFFFLMNLAVGGNYLGNPTNAEINPNMPGEIVIDYMRVYNYTSPGLVTNIVPSVVQQGVDLDWPTIVNTNYQPQWTSALLPTNTPWSNLVSQITGNGATNSLFDPFGSFQQKFYQVLQISGGRAPNSGNQILNPGFEIAGATLSNAANWTVDLAVGGPVYAIRTNDNPHSGSFNFEVHLASTGNGPAVEFNQSGIPVTGGASYTLSFYVDRLTGSSADVDQYNVEWLNSNTVVVAQTGNTSYTPGANAYAQTVVTGLTAPATATSATIFFHSAGASSPSLHATLDFDDMTFSNSAAGGSSSGILTNQVQAGIAQSAGITWFASNGVPYQVQWSPDQVSWNNLGSQITGMGSSNTVFDTAGQSGHNYYQVLSFQ